MIVAGNLVFVLLIERTGTKVCSEEGGGSSEDTMWSILEWFCINEKERKRGKVEKANL